MYCCITPERFEKSARIMRALARGWPDSVVVTDEPPNDGKPFCCLGQEWLTLRIIPEAYRTGRPFWHCDNGFWCAAKGTDRGYYRVTYKKMSPVALESPDSERGHRLGGTSLKPWRSDGRHVLLALPGPTFAMAIGLDIQPWLDTIQSSIAEHTDRPIVVRPKNSTRPLAEDLKDAWAVVTYGSNVAVDAIVAGVPVFCADVNPAAPVGNLDLADLEQPRMPCRRDLWWASLMCQQFTLGEMKDGTAYRYMTMVQQQVDKKTLRPRKEDAA